MSAIDNQIKEFYGHMASLSWSIGDCAKWMKDYEENRMGYPAWVTKDGTQIRVYEIEDSHLDNLIPFVQKKDPKNETHWADVFKAEKRYRELKEKMSAMKSELASMEYVSDLCM